MDIALPLDYTPREYQLPAWNFFMEGGKRGVCVWHRRAGKDLLAINLIVTKAVQRTGLYWHLLPTYNQGRKIVWDGFTGDGKKFRDAFPKELIKRQNNTDMRIEMTTGSIYQVVGTDEVDRLVGTNPIGCVFSEYSLHDPRAWDYIRPILSENGGWALFIYTARGKNHGYTLLQMSKKRESWFSSTLTVEDTFKPGGGRVITEEAVEEERLSGMPPELILQEFFVNFDAPIVGAYYSKQLRDLENKKRFTKVPYDPALVVHTGWDLGMSDTTCIWFFQEYGFEIRVIDYYENSGEGLAHYKQVLNDRGYTYGRHYGPHDITVRELGTGKSRLEVAKTLGMRFIVVDRHKVEDGIEATRNLLPMCYFDEENCSRGIEALRSYRKERDESKEQKGADGNFEFFKSSPVHDWASHPADAFRTYSWGRKKRKKQQKRPEFAIDGHAYI